MVPPVAVQTDMTSQSKKKQAIRPIEGLAAELVVNHVRGLIVAGELRRGQRLPPERELVRGMGLSRTSVRAGLQALVAKGVLITRPGAGTFVADGPPVLDADALSFLAVLHGFSRHEMFEARRTLEVRVAGMAAERATGDDLAAISDEVTGMYAAVDDRQTFLVHDIRFHRAIAAASGNAILAAIVEMVSSLFYEQRRRTADLARNQRPVADTHRRIYLAIRNRDREAAEKEMCEHLLVAEREQEVERLQQAAAADVPVPDPTEQHQDR